MKRGMSVLILVFLFVSVTFVVAQETDVVAITTNESLDDVVIDDDGLYEGYEDEELKQSAGLVPGDMFYFIDRFFDRFGDDLSVKEERIAEIKQLIEEGDIENAKIALEEYMELADKVERNVDPESREEAKRSAAAIRNAMKDIRDLLPEGERGKFVSDVMSKEHAIATAAEIAGKIKDLCVQLSELDPGEYFRVCRSDDDSPDWRKKLDRDLTEEQRKEAKAFGDIMSKCFETSGQDCACEDISFYDFSVACSKAAPLVIACDIEGDKDACDDLDNLEMPELPDYLQDVMDDIESQYSEDKYGMYMPQECIEAGVTSPKECGKIMIKEHAPLECKAALLEADVSSEREGREICDKIMMKEYAPQCVEKGIADPEECKKFMDSFRDGDRREDRPSQCNSIDMTNEECAEWVVETLGMPEPCAGLDEAQCKKILVGEWGGLGKYEIREFDGRFVAPGRDCMSIEDSGERLKCFENAVGDIGNYYGIGKEYEGEGELTWQCKENRIHWAPDCEVFMREKWPEQERMRMEEADSRRDQEEYWRGQEKECANICESKGGAWDFSGGKCECKFYDYPTEEKTPDIWADCSSIDCVQGSHCEYGKCVVDDKIDVPQYAGGEGSVEPNDYQEDTTESNNDASTDSSSGTTDSSGGGGSSNSGSIEETVATSVVTGEVVSNVFLDYYDSIR